MITDKSLVAEWEKKVVKNTAIEYGPDDVVFTKAYGAPAKIATTKATTRSPLELLSDYSAAWAEHGVPWPDLVFQTAAQGLYFYRHCLSYGAFVPSRPPDAVDGMCIARVMGVNLIWPEK